MINVDLFFISSDRRCGTAAKAFECLYNEATSQHQVMSGPDRQEILSLFAHFRSQSVRYIYNRESVERAKNLPQHARSN